MKQGYSGTGDQGSTGLLGPTRVSKTHQRIQAVGAIDEASAALGMARSLANKPNLNELIQHIQRDLYQIMSLVVLESSDPVNFPDLPLEKVAWLEKTIEHYQKSTASPGGFILPGDTQLSAAFSLARTIVRRAEREVVGLHDADLLLSSSALPYLNRLSSLCYVLELFTSDQITPASPSNP